LVSIFNTSGYPETLYASASSLVSQKPIAIASERSGATKVISSRNPFCLRRSGKILLSTTLVNSVVAFGFSSIMTWRVNMVAPLGCWLWTSGDLGDSRGAEKRVSLNSIRRVPYHAPAHLLIRVYSKCHEYRIAQE